MDLALALGEKTKRKQRFDELRFLVPGGQKEKLVTRLRGILSAYPCDDGIMKELLQNADDAHATEIHFIKDYRTHACEKIFDEKYAPLQGPALCVFNNSSVTKQDIEGFHDLCLGNKGEDPLKTGQYGVGFNAVYHFTDAPSFLTKGPGLEHGEMLCVFDPTCQYLPKVTEQNPGVLCLVGAIRKNYPDVLKGYLEEDLFKSNVGTMFRFPLRNEKATKDMLLSSKRVDEEEVSNILRKFCDDSLEVLLFLKHVSKIIVSNISSGEIKEEYRVEAKLSEEDRRKRDKFFQFVKQTSDQYKLDRTYIINMSSKEVSYTVTVSDSRGELKSFYVVQRMGFKDGFILPETVVRALKDKNLRQLPMGGVAFVIPNKHTLIEKVKEQDKYCTGRDKKYAIEPKKENGRAFCFLPLPLRTGLPCHINGHFVLDHEARRSLWKELQDYRHDWNHCILESIVSPAYISALMFLKQHLLHDLSKHSLKIVQRLLDEFLSYFPLKDVATEDDSKAVVKYVYVHLYLKEVQLFPILQEKDNVRFAELSLEWAALQMSGHVFPAYFHHQDCHVSKLLKLLGMKIIEIPEIIRKSIEESGIKTAMVTPSSVFKFLKSFSFTGLDKCNLKVNVPVSETTFASIDNVRSIIEYIARSDKFEKEIDNTPLLVTNDGALRTFSNIRPIICSSYVDLLPFSSELVVHADLISCKSQIFWKSGVLLDLVVHNFIDLLPSTLSSQVFQVGQDVLCQTSSHEIPNETWILRFWQFIYDLSVKSTQLRTQNIDQEAFKESLGMLAPWSLLPVQHSDDKHFLLRPISKAYTIIDLWSFDRVSDLRSALEKLDLPKLDTVIFTKRDRMDILRMVRSLVASNTEPMEVLNCLQYHKNKIRYSSLTPKECNAILVFFSKHMTKLRQHADESSIRDRIKSLPLHITLQGTSTSLDGNEKVLILPLGIPADGLHEWAANTGYILVRQNKDLGELHNVLQCAFANTIDVYCFVILPNFDALPKCCHLQHLLYIKETLLHRSHIQTTFDQTQQQLIKVLQSIPFIATADRMKLSSEFYDPYHEVFACMCNKSNFPPSPYNLEYWIEFMRLTGLKTKVSESMFVEFAESLALEGAYQFSDTVCQKSRILVKAFWASTPTSWESSAIERLAKVKFIAPHYVSSDLSSLSKQNSESSSLMCFSQSTTVHFELLCWTSMNLLPMWACPEPERWKQILLKLGVHLRPPVERVVLQLQNVCDVQKRIFASKEYVKSDITWLPHLLDRMYEYLSEHSDEDPMMKEKLADAPVVFLPMRQLLLPAKNIVVDLSGEEIVEPYLYRAPNFYERYYDFFIYLGASQQVSLNHYFIVLRLVCQMQRDHDEKLLPESMKIVGNSVRNIVSLLKNKPEKDIDLDEKILYLPDRSKRLRDARSLIVADNGYLESRLNECQLDYFIGFKQLEVKVQDPRPIIKALPVCYRPKLLSQVVKEEVDLTEMKEIQSAEAERCERFLHSADFVQGILRLVKHEKTKIGQTFTPEDEEKCFAQIKGLEIKEVRGLYTYLQISGERIESSKRKETCFIKRTMNENVLGFTLYFQVEKGRENTIQKDLVAKPNGIIDLIKRCTDNSIRQSTEILYGILDCFQESYKITNTLDRLYIDPYDYSINHTLDLLDVDPYDSQQRNPCSIFPRPGTYVPQKFHAFLHQGFSVFQEHEYESVVYEPEDDMRGSDSDDSVYIYARILRPVESKYPSGTGIKVQYLIDIGDQDKGHVIVYAYAYNLFKFEQRPASSSQDLIPSGCLPVGSLPFDEICRQIMNILREAWTLPKEERRRVLKRLLLRWHPDRNIGQEDCCSRIFGYIQDVVSKLDGGRSLDCENINLSNCEGRCALASTESENTGRRVNRPSAQYMEQHGERENAYRKAQSEGDVTSGSSCAAFSVPDQPNALHWLQQAKQDLSSAKDFLPQGSGVPAFSWTCYHCQQATEKALKAAVYATDANKVDPRSHQLASIARKGMVENTSHALYGDKPKISTENQLRLAMNCPTI